MSKSLQKLRTKEIKVLTFDFWETLYNDAPDIENRRKCKRVEILGEYFKDHKKPEDAESLLALYDSISQKLQAFVSGNHNRTTYSMYDIVSQMLTSRGYNTDDEVILNEVNDLATRIDNICLEHRPKLDEQAGSVLAELMHSHSLAIISNTEGTTGNTLRQLMKADGILDFFKKLIFSDEIGITKPDPYIFEKTLHYFEVSPAQGLHVGDSLQNDYNGAIQSGMQAVHLNNAQEVDNVLTIRKLDDLLKLVG